MSDLPVSIKEKLKGSISKVPKDVITGYGKIK